jgi:hypothetical protein
MEGKISSFTVWLRWQNLSFQHNTTKGYISEMTFLQLQAIQLM